MKIPAAAPAQSASHPQTGIGMPAVPSSMRILDGYRADSRSGSRREIAFRISDIAPEIGLDKKPPTRQNLVRVEDRSQYLALPQQ